MERRIEDRESAAAAAAAVFFLEGELCEETWMYLQRDFFPTDNFGGKFCIYVSILLRRQVRRGRVCCNAVKTDFSGG